MVLALLTSCGLLVLVLYKTLLTEDSPGSECTPQSGPMPLSLKVARCQVAPCLVQQGEDALINFTIQIPRNTTSLKTVATAYLDTFVGIVLPIPVDLAEKATTCNFLNNATCPLQAGAVVNYTLSLAIPASIPTGISPTMQFSILDDQDLPVTCIRLPVVVVSSEDNEKSATAITTNTTTTNATTTTTTTTTTTNETTIDTSTTNITTNTAITDTTSTKPTNTTTQAATTQKSLMNLTDKNVSSKIYIPSS